MGAAGKRAHSATESKPPDGDRPPDPPEELLVLHLDDEDASDPEEVAIDSHGRVKGETASVTTRDAHDLDDGRPQPEYEIVFKQRVSPEDLFLGE